MGKESEADDCDGREIESEAASGSQATACKFRGHIACVLAENVVEYRHLV